ncbi:plasma membrane calcium [Umbelopsis nana]
MTTSSPKPAPPTIITDPSALNDRSVNTPALTLYSASDANLESAPPTPMVEPEQKQDDTKSSSHVNIEQLLKPHENPDNPFAFTSEQLSALYDPKNIELLSAYGGVEGIANGLHSNVKNGLSADEHAPFEPITLNDIIEPHEANDTKTESDRLKSATPPPTNHTTANSRFDQRQAIFGANVLPDVKAKNIFQLMWMAFKDKTLILLTVAAIISLAVGLYEALGQPPQLDAYGNPQPDVKWVEGVAIIVAIVLVVTVGSVNDFQKEKQFRKLNAKKEDRDVRVTRSAQQAMISIRDLQVGDILHLEPGEIIPADGIFIDGHNVKCDESTATGETDAVKKQGWLECYRLHEIYHRQHPDDGRSVSGASGVSKPDSPSTLVPSPTQANNHLSVQGNFLAPPSPITKDSPSSSAVSTTSSEPVFEAGAHLPDPFLISGSKVLEGVGSYMVTNVGESSFNGKTLMALRTEAQSTPLQEKLDGLAEMIAKLGSAAGLLMLVVLLIRYFVGWKYHAIPSSPAKIVDDIMQIIIVTVTIVVVAVPEGLPLAVTLALAYATQRMLKDNNLVRVLAACETMGNATTVCSDKTGTLTQNVMTVVCGTLGNSLRFQKDVPSSRTDLVELSDVKAKAPLSVSLLVNQAVAVNSTAFESTAEDGKVTLVGNKTETAMLAFSQSLADNTLSHLRARWSVEQVFPFSSERKAMATVIRIVHLSDEGKEKSVTYRVHIKGASETLVDRCSKILSMHDPAYRYQTDVTEENFEVKTRDMTEAHHTRMNKIIQSYASRSLRTMALCYRDYDHWPPRKSRKYFQEEEIEVPYEDLVDDNQLTLIGVVGIEDPLRPGVKDAVIACQKAGVFVRMVTGDNMTTAKSIAKQCGIYTSGGIVMEGPVFRNLPPAEMDEVIPRLQVLARSSPEDKRILVGRLKELGETVAVTGDGTNDAPALKLADVGFSMGITGTEVAKEASSIILMDDNFSSIVKAVSWGRCVNDAVKKFLQFQLTVNITAVLLTFISAVVSSSQKSVLTAVQLLWVNLIMDTFAALALATDPPTPELLLRNPEPRSAPLITFPMWKMIIGQSIFQVVVTLILLYSDILDYPTDSTFLQTVVFNTFVFCQIFNEINCRRIDNRFNILSGLHKNVFFIIIFLICVIGQVIIVQWGGQAFQTTPIDGTHWAISIVVGMLSIPIGAVIRMIPDDIFGIFFRNENTRIQYLQPEKLLSSNRTPSVYVAGGERFAWNNAYTNVTRELLNFREPKAEGHLHRRRSSKALAAAIVPSFIATAPGAGWVASKEGESSQDHAAAQDTNNSCIDLERCDSLSEEHTNAEGSHQHQQDQNSKLQ